MNKFYWSALLAVFVVVSGLIIYFGFSPGEVEAPISFSTQKDQTSLLIDFGAKKRMFVGETISNMTVLDALNFSANGNNLEYKLDNARNYLAAVDGFVNDGKKWVVYLNSAKQTRAINEIIVKVGDEVELKFE